MSHLLSPSERSEIIRAASAVGTFTSRDIAKQTELGQEEIEAFLSSGVRHRLFTMGQQIYEPSYELVPSVAGLLDEKVIPAKSVITDDDETYTTVDLLRSVFDDVLAYASGKREWGATGWTSLKRTFSVFKEGARAAVQALVIYGEPADADEQALEVEGLIANIETTIADIDTRCRKQFLSRLDHKITEDPVTGLDFVVGELGSWAHTTGKLSLSDPYIFILDALQDGLSDRLAEAIRDVNAQVAKFRIASMADEQRNWLYCAVDELREDLDAKLVFAVDSDRHDRDSANWAAEIFRLTMPIVGASALHAGFVDGVHHQLVDTNWIATTADRRMHEDHVTVGSMRDSSHFNIHPHAHRPWRIYCLDRGERSAAIAEAFREIPSMVYLANVQDDDVDRISAQIF